MEHREPLKHLVIYCHPYAASLSAAYRDEVVRLTEAAGHCAIVRDLYNINFCPVLSVEDLNLMHDGKIPEDILLEQDYVKGADLITFIYPIWWGGMPALMKGYIDRVFSRGFAYDIDIAGSGEIKRLLTGKQLIVLNNFGSCYEDYQKGGMLDALKKTSDVGIFEFCGMRVMEHHFFGNIGEASEKERKGHIKTLTYIYNRFLPPR